MIAARPRHEGRHHTYVATALPRSTGVTPVRLQDVALVADGFQDVTNYARSNGATVQALGILKQPGSNALSVAKSVRASLDKLRPTLPPGMSVDVIFDTTGFIQESVNEIALELGLAVILTGLVCWIFLGSLSSTMNVLFAIPMSLLGTIAILYFAGFTLNTLTLLCLSLAVGLVVDDAIMVMENIFRHAEMGKDRVRAAADGTKEITSAALAATIAVIAIFMPVAFMSGVVGKFLLQFGVTLSVAVAISYVEAITLAPAPMRPDAPPAAVDGGEDQRAARSRCDEVGADHHVADARRRDQDARVVREQPLCRTQ